jgi:hypothetical protein
MLHRFFTYLLCSVWLLCSQFKLQAQEHVTYTDYNPWVKSNTLKPAQQKTTALSLPFFDDFTNYDATPDQSKWADKQTYVNNTMGVNVVSRGVATFDALSQYGMPYDTLNNSLQIYGDSLTSRPIDLSGYNQSDSLYLSFYYQPQGNGFAPEIEDSLQLYMLKKNGVWQRVWGVPGTALTPFQIAMVPIVDTQYLYPNFKFRFVNKVSINTNDDVWNIDYVKLDAHRNIADTTMSDVGMSAEPTCLLNDYTSMPYRQFAVNMSSETSAQHTAYTVNPTGGSYNILANFAAREALSNTPLATGNFPSATIVPFTTLPMTFPMYPVSFTAPGNFSKVVFENKYYIHPTTALDPPQNDTIIRNLTFDNYLAYDDGTAEMSYYLNLFATLPGKLAIEYHLNKPDTLTGFAVYFGRQVPTAWYKNFSLVVYSDIGVNGSGAEHVVYQEDDFTPKYIDTVNHFWMYALSAPVALPQGTFYLGTTQPALSGSDSLYFGLDVNRVGGNHLYYNTLNVWSPSTVSGAVMLRPLLGPFTPSTNGVATVTSGNTQSFIAPNPCTDKITFHFTTTIHTARYEISDVQGRLWSSGPITNAQTVDMSTLSSGMYFVRLIQGEDTFVQKIIKN